MKMMSIAGPLLLALTLGGTAAEAAGPSPLGLWARGDGRAKVRIEPCGAAICAINTWIKEGTPEEKVGDKLVMNVTPVDATHWSGTAFDPQRDRSYKMKLEIAEGRMTTSGCVLAGLLCADMAWTRTENAAAN
ncbi:DUF2147 domain-containing protein [Siculibacillus lacustris]|uniref:DUF2147 domain-containing protein n=1 Tax=Siculibacillus lacustris TaxID=1549641 RepID=A0A4Q9VZB9_9HYPH|nr:DUF2147 domain-containing protein [Siculibacillus lacustris]TBW40706.1 DUF2147 domain-containing protein [Siculibacillus lacustris]